MKHSLKCIGVLRGLGLILGIIISLSILVGFVLIINKIKTELHTDYMSAQDAIKAGDYQQAMDIFDMLGPNYQETQKYKEYTRAIMLYNDKKFKEAETVFKSLGNFEETSGYLLKIQDEEVEDSRERLYTEACKYYAENNYAKASDIFSSLGDYENSQSLVERSKTLWRQQCSNIISAGIRCSVGITDSGGVKLSCEDFFFGRNDIEQK